MSSSYASFLERKARRAPLAGIEVNPSELHPSLFDFQKKLVLFALQRGRSACFADTGLGKTRVQVEWARLAADRSLIVAPLSVARQTVREAQKIDVDVRYVRDGRDVDGPGVWITNYEMVSRFDPTMFGAVALDESSLLKNVDGKTRRLLTDTFRVVPHRLACTATPAPNDVAELTNHAEYLGVMSRAEMLAAYFINDEKEWRLKGWAAEPMFRWMGSWAQALRRPSDMGGSDDGYELPPLEIIGEVVHSEIQSEGQLFATDLGGVGGRARVRRMTLNDRVRRAIKLCDSDDEQWIVWCGLNDEASAVAGAVEGAVNVEGAWSPDAKAQALEAFQDGEIRVLVTKTAIAGLGMNMQNCSHMAFVGLNDSYEAYYQAIRRCWRFGQQRPVKVHVIVSALEASIVENVRRKEAASARMTDQLIRQMRSPEMGAKTMEEFSQ
jgi:superfamily II DNA or RNA helicase